MQAPPGTGAPHSRSPTGRPRPRRRWRWLLLAAVALAVVVLLLGLAGLGLRHLSRRNVFPGSPVAIPPERELAARGLARLDYRSSDGLALQGVLAEPDRPGAPVVVYFHGNAESAARNLDLALALDRAGFGALLAEYRGYGGLEGTPTEEGVLRDATAAVEALGARGIERGRLILVGRSLGSGVALELSARGVGRGLVLVSPYTSMVDMARRFVGPLAPLVVPDRFDSEARAPSVAVPAVVLHGTEDELVPFRMGERLAASLPRGRLVPLPGVGHNDIPGLAELVVREVAALAAEGEAAAPGRAPSP